ncbi:MAG: histidine phosphatase family protein [Thermoanaerobaculia bacterium]
MRVCLIRHGESEGNVAATLQGCRLDTPLSPRGRKQAESLAIRLLNEPMDAVIASPMSRARETAEIVAAPHGLGISTDADLLEFDWGSWTGRSLDQEMERHVAELRARWRAGEVDVRTPGGESPVLAAVRAGRFLARLRAKKVLAPLVVAHGRFNRVLMALILNRDLSRMDEIKQRNGSVSIFELDEEGKATSVSLDDVEHLSAELRVVTGANDSVR